MTDDDIMKNWPWLHHRALGPGAYARRLGSICPWCPCDMGIVLDRFGAAALVPWGAKDPDTYPKLALSRCPVVVNAWDVFPIWDEMRKRMGGHDAESRALCKSVFGATLETCQRRVKARRSDLWRGKFMYVSGAVVSSLFHLWSIPTWALSSK